MEMNYLKCDRIQTVQPIDFKFITYDSGYFVMRYADFGEHRSKGISTGEKEIILIHYMQWIWDI